MGFSVLVGNLGKKLLVYLLFSVAVNSFGQTSVIDSLKKALKSAPDNNKIQFYHALIIKIWRNNPDSAMFYARRAIQFARQTNDLRAEAIAVRLKGGAYFYLGNYDSFLFFSKQ